MNDMFSLKGKIAIITGGNQGLGQGICEAYAKMGCNIVSVARRDSAETKEICEKYNVKFLEIKADLSNRESINMIIDECNKNGGGTVLVPNGFYLTGPINIKSNINFHLEKGAFIKFTKSYEEYPLHFTEYEGIRRIRAISPITIENAQNVAITGEGVIDGSGDLWRGIKKFKVTEKKWR